MDSATLRGILARTDGSSDAIKNSAGAMMKFYDKAPLAVTEWRNALQTCQPHQLLPLLYVANEVLQNSKRNRGTKFLEAFSPVLGQSLVVMVERDLSILEKVRRTAKIWGDRRVLSIRFVNELLFGLEPFREQAHESPVGGNFSPEPAKEEKATPTQAATQAKSSPARVTVSSVDNTQDNDSDDNDDNNDGFGDSLGHLDVNLDFLSNTPNASFSTGSGKKKRRNSSMTPTTQNKRRKTILSTTSLMDLWNQVSTLQDSLDSSSSLLKEISQAPTTQVDQLVGDELLSEYKKVCKSLDQVYEQKSTLHKIAKDRKVLEQEAVRYIPWLQASLKNDDDDVKFCRDLSEKITLATMVHARAKQARDTKREKEELQLKLQQEEERRKSEEEERKKFMESAMKKETEAKPGMVWSRERQEYVHLNTDESWRD